MNTLVNEIVSSTPIKMEIESSEELIPNYYETKNSAARVTRVTKYETYNEEVNNVSNHIKLEVESTGANNDSKTETELDTPTDTTTPIESNTLEIRESEMAEYIDTNHHQDVARNRYEENIRYIRMSINTITQKYTPGTQSTLIFRDRMNEHMVSTRNAKPKYMSHDVFQICLSFLKLKHNEKAIMCLVPLATIPNEVTFLLAFGPRFSVPIPFNKVSAELLLDSLKRLNSFHMSVYERQSLTAIAKQHMEYFEKENTKVNNELQMLLVHSFNCVIRFFTENSDLMIALADKGNITIIMEKREYIKKMNDILNVSNTYQLVRATSLNAYIKQNQTLLKRVAKLNVIPMNHVPTIVATENTTANMYGLIKIHKEDYPARPIVNTRCSPGYMLSKILNQVFTPAKENHKYNIRNSKELVERINTVTPNPNEYLATLDIKDMFTNINTAAAIRAVEKRINNNTIKTIIPIDLIITLMRFVTSYSTEITFNGNTFKQIRGLRMGSCLSQILADFVTEDIIDDTFIHMSLPKFFTKYVDDCAIMATSEHTERILQKLNANNNGILLTLTMEDTDGDITYLDTVLHNTHAFAIFTRWQPKIYASNRILNYISTHHRNMKINTAKSFVSNMYKLTSLCYRDKLHNLAEKILESNNFPNSLRLSIINDTIKNLNNVDDPSNMIINHALSNELDPFQIEYITMEDRKQFVSIPYIPTLSTKIAGEIKRFNPQITVTHKPIPTMKKMINEHKNLRKIHHP